jgi:protein-ribulosamine 3-kinase
MNPALKEYIIQLLPASAGKPGPVFRSVGGGSINSTWQIDTNNGKFFCKLNSASSYPQMFEKEARGLNTLRETGTVATPQVVAEGTCDGQQVLVLEWVEPGARTTSFWTNFGEQLASLHRQENADTDKPFGFHEDNYMGALEQLNTPMDNWCDFFLENRLQPQVRLALQNKLLPAAEVDAFDKLYRRLPDIFPVEPASLVHGDLWSGNFLCDASSRPVLIDPAVYFGHRGMDLAMTTLFGGFDKAFYDAYHYWYPLPPGHKQQWAVCNLYPLLIHLNLFGSGYLSSIKAILRGF